MIKQFLIVWIALLLTPYLGRSVPVAGGDASPGFSIKQIIIKKPGPHSPPTTTTPAAGALGGVCSTGDDCVVAESECTDGTCSCRNGFLEDGSECLRKKNIDEACSKNIECPDNSVCDTNCVCAPNFVNIPGQKCFPYKELGDSCEWTLQCSEQTINTECDAGTSKCACTGSLVPSKTKTCVPAQITIDMRNPFPAKVWNSNLATVGSAEYDALKADVNTIYSSIPGHVSYTNLVFEDENGKATAVFSWTILNPEAASRRRLRRDVDQPIREDIDEPITEDVDEPMTSEEVIKRVPRDVEWIAKQHGYQVTGVLSKVKRGQLHSFCLTDADCNLQDGSCINTACSCKSGSVEDNNGQAACKRALLY